MAYSMVSSTLFVYSWYMNTSLAQWDPAERRRGWAVEYSLNHQWDACPSCSHVCWCTYSKSIYTVYIMVYCMVYITVYTMVYCMVYITVYTMVYTVIYTMQYTMIYTVIYTFVYTESYLDSLLNCHSWDITRSWYWKITQQCSDISRFKSRQVITKFSQGILITAPCLQPAQPLGCA